ncbi:MAG: energy transducer TonB [Polaribacter sp.]|nr:energy transducer TonB [Polaribacter sp.]
MAILETRHKKKSAVITAIIMVLLVLGILNFGMRYLDPPEEYGLAINFGTSNVGSGDPVVKTKAKPVLKQPVEKVEEKKAAVATPKETLKEKLITQDTKEAPVVEKLPTKKVEKPVEVVKKKPKPAPSKETQDALNKLLKGNATTGKPAGEGDAKNPGVKGVKKGDPKSTKYYGNDGSGGDSNYNLAGRKALSKPIEKPDCNEEGIVVVRIEVDKTGKVIKAIAGVKGTTNTASCLLKPAKAAALKTRWNRDGNAPVKQKGTIIYKFSLSQ